MNRLNASDIQIATPVHPLYFTDLLANPITKRNDKQLVGVVDVITYLTLHQNALNALQSDVVAVRYNGEVKHCYVLDFWQEDHDKHRDSILGGDVKTVIQLEVIE